jgi:hypothetical protein
MILWRRLDSPGHDACRLDVDAQGFSLVGAAVFRHHGKPAFLEYRVSCDGAWRTLRGDVTGWIGEAKREFGIERTPEGLWTLNGESVTGLDDCVDLDLGFTPATNTFQIRRCKLGVGESAAVPAAWLDVSSGLLERLEQRYEHRTRDAYYYEAPRFEYAALLGVRPVGFIHSYPGLWQSEE